MKTDLKIFVVETTSGDKWEVAPGFYLVKAKTKKGVEKIMAEKMIKGFTDEKISSIDEINTFFKKGNCEKIFDGSLFELQMPQVQ